MKDNAFELRELIRFILMERQLDSKRVVQSKILSIADEMFGPGLLRAGHGKSGEIRLQPKDRTTKFSFDEIERLMSTAGYSISKVINPGNPGSMSSKFITYLNDSGYAVVVAGGGTRGQEFERKIQTSSLDSGDLKSLIDSLKEKIDGLEIVGTSPGPSHVKRPLGMKPEDVGVKIADLILKTNKEEKIYISLKDPTGSTFGNFGIVGSFEYSNGEIISKEHPLDTILQSLGIDKSLIAEGLNSYSKDDVEKEPKINDVKSYDPHVVSGIIQSGYGYGYWYARKISEGWKLVDLTTKENLNQYVGQVASIKLRYPDSSSKQCSAWVTMTSGDVYKFEIRNTKGGIIPTEIKVKVQKSFKKAEDD